MRSGARLVARLQRAKPRVYMGDDKRYRLWQVGVGTYGEPTVMYWDTGATLRVGAYCSIGDDVKILLGGEHHTEWISTYPFPLLQDDVAHFGGYPLSKGDVEIENDIWIGRESMILSGVTIGNGAVVGAGSVVARDVEPYSVVAGNPARLVRRRFDAKVVDQLQRIAWWAWPETKVREARSLLMSSDMSTFLATYGRQRQA